MQPRPLIVVRDVEASSRFYQALLACHSGHGGPEYERIVDAHGRLVLQLHGWDTEEHPHMGHPSRPVGNGVLLWFETPDFDAALARARSSGTIVLDGPLVNPNSGQRELWLRDPDGYVVVLATPEP